MRVRVGVALLTAIAAAGCGQAGFVPGGEGAPKSEDVTFTPGARNGVTRWVDPGLQDLTTAAASTAHLNYYGGKVISNVKVTSVNWGSAVNSSYSSQLPGFYAAITQSAHWDWLTEYNTTISGGTQQTIGHGSFSGTVNISPSNTATALTDAQIQTEINSQISAGVLPAPDDNVIYMVNFPKGIKITGSDGSKSCQSGGFCAYHGTFKRGSQNVYYGVLPSNESGSGCDVGCGNNASPFNNYTSVASHELVEAVTDAEVGLSTTVGPPLAWYDPSQGEIGDICNAQQGSITASNGTVYTVQKEFDNATSSCIVTKSTGGGGGDTVLSNGVSLTNQSGATNAQAFYRIDVPAGASNLSVRISGGTGDADLYVKAGARPTLSTYDCRPYVSGNTETCSFATPTTGSYYVLLNGYAAYSGVTLVASYSTSSGGTGNTVLTLGTPITGISGATSSQQYWQVTVPSGKTSLKVAISGGTGDADLYVRLGANPTTTTYDCRPYLTGNNETCTINAPSAGTYDVMIRGYQAYSGVTLSAN